MRKAYYTYRLQVANYQRVQVDKLNTQRQSIAQADGAFRYQEKREEIKSLLESIRNNQLNSSDEAKKFGEALFDILFDDVLCHNFFNFYHQVVHTEKQFLRVELDIDERAMPEIAALPWEFMCLPERANLSSMWMSTASQLVFSRRRKHWIPVRQIQLDKNEKLRIALVVSAPSNLNEVVYKPVQEALEKLASEQVNRIELLPIVNSANPELIEELLSKEPHIFHFIGHGRLENENNQEVGEVALVDPETGEEMWVDASFFSSLFNENPPSVIMLQACEGARQSASKAFVGVAAKCHQQNIPVVVAMQYEVSNMTAKRFALRFYRQLAKDDPVDIAAQVGRKAITFGPTQYRKRDFATPVIFMRVEDGYLFELPKVLESPDDSVSNPDSSSLLKSSTSPDVVAAQT
ncbi:MAG: CHAT domain-containing protein, partial [Coleofasciculus sp. Co-bin14]|nr:CHAT domain-containing protein [Coleofasciculus sp. Co-bin14]